MRDPDVRRRISIAKHAQSSETRLQISSTLQGHFVSKTTREKISTTKRVQRLKTGHYFRGGPIGDAFEALLCPAGYVREYFIQRSGIGRGHHYRLDFAHPTAKVNIELDGPYHYSLPEEDRERDIWLRERGWKVIRIRHD